jgi:hypothetical protein
MTMRKLLIAAVALAALAGSANAETYTYMCRVGSKSYPITVFSPKGGALEGSTIMWRGKVFRDVEVGDGCKAQFFAQSDNGDALELCAATQGYASLTIGVASYDCEMPGRRR